MSEMYEQVVLEWRRAARAVEHKRAQHALDHAATEPRLRDAEFAVAHKDELDELSELAGAADVEHILLEKRTAAAIDSLHSIWRSVSHSVTANPDLDTKNTVLQGKGEHESA